VVKIENDCCYGYHSEFATNLYISTILLPIFFFIYLIIGFIFSIKINLNGLYIFVIVPSLLIPWVYDVIKNILK